MGSTVGKGHRTVRAKGMEPRRGPGLLTVTRAAGAPSAPVAVLAVDLHRFKSELRLLVCGSTVRHRHRQV